MKDKALAQSKAFWSALEKADVSGMQAVADPKCMMASASWYSFPSRRSYID